MVQNKAARKAVTNVTKCMNVCWFEMKNRFLYTLMVFSRTVRTTLFMFYKKIYNYLTRNSVEGFFTLSKSKTKSALIIYIIKNNNKIIKIIKRH